MTLSRLNNPGGLSTLGVPVLGGLGMLPPSPGKYFFVDSTNGSDGNDGLNPDRPYATIQAAVNASADSRGDVIVVQPNHTETVSAAAGLDLNKIGVTIVGLGSGAARPTINFTTATTADMDVDAADVTMINIVFTGGIDALAGPVDVNADDFSLLNCEFRDVTGQTVDWLIANGVSRTKVVGLRVIGAAADGGNSALQLTNTTDTEVIDFKVSGNFDSGFIQSVTTANANLLVHTGYFENAGAQDRFMTVQATDTGWCGGLGERAIFARIADNAANIDEIIVQSDGTTIVSDMQFVSDGIHVVNLDNERTIAWTGVAQSTDA